MFGHRPDGLAIGAVVAELAIAACLHESRLFEGLELQRDGAERHVRHRATDVAGRAFFVPDEPENLPAAGGREGLQQHGVNLVKTKIQVNLKNLTMKS